VPSGDQATDRDRRVKRTRTRMDDGWASAIPCFDAAGIKRDSRWSLCDHRRSHL